MALYDYAKCQCRNQYIHYGDQIISMKCVKSLICVTIWDPTREVINHITCIVIILNYPWESFFSINYDLEVKVI